jgi:hypothetical protein
MRSYIALVVAVCGCSIPMESEESFETTNEFLYRSDEIWPAASDGVRRIQTCFQPGAVSHPDYQQRAADIKYALAMSWERFGNIEFTGWGACSGNTDYVLKIDSTTGGHSASGGYKQDATMFLNFGDGAFLWKVMHEFGHTLGFAHEHHRPDGWNFDANGQPTTHKYCGFFNPNDDAHRPMTFSDAGGLPMWISYGVYDIMSITHYYGSNDPNPDCNARPARLSAGDISGLHQVYGRSRHMPALESLPAQLIQLM